MLLAGLLAGCAGALPPSREPISPEARRALDLLTERWQEFSGLRTLADVAVKRFGEQHAVRAVVLARAPDSVRFEALSPMGQPLLIATIHDGRLVAYDATTNEATVGTATADVTARVLGLPLEPRDLVAVLAGRALPPPDVKTAELVSPDDVGPSLRLSSPVSRRRIWLDLASGLPSQLELAGGRVNVTIRYRRDPAGQISGLDVAALMSSVTASVRYSNPVFGSDLDPDLFAFTPPKGAKIKEIR